MGQPKKRRSPSKQGLRRQHLVKKLAARVNATSPVKVELSRGGERQDAPKQKTKPAAKKQ